ncbi:MAG: anti-sigma factor family protein, partial [Anaerolineae bacterium]
MDHTEVIAKLPQYLDDDLSDEEYLQLEAHLEDCDACQKKIDELLAKNTQVSRYTDEEILRLLRTGYILSDRKEREL